MHCIIFAGLFFLVTACDTLEEPLVLDQDYLHVADVLEFCQGPCQGTLAWENNNVLVKGYIPEVENDSILNEDKNNARFYLTDIRNGMFIEIRVDGDVDAVFQFLFGINKTDRLYIRGKAESILANQGSECIKGVIVQLSDVANMEVNLE
jgi:hypothetical protein